MTSDEVKQLREAAEYVLATNDEITDDSRAIVVSFARSLVGTDGELPVTEEWLNSNFVCKSVGLIRLVVGGNGSILSFNTRTIGVSLDGRVIVNCTRYQFRLLAAALGIPKKGE